MLLQRQRGPGLTSVTPGSGPKRNVIEGLSGVPDLKELVKALKKKLRYHNSADLSFFQMELQPFATDLLGHALARVLTPEPSTSKKLLRTLIPDLAT